MAIDPLYADAHYNLGKVLEKLARPAEAAEAYRAAIRAQPDYGDAVLALERVAPQRP